MFLHPNNILFFSVLLSSLIMITSSDSWLMIWLFLEINMMSFIPFLLKSKGVYQSESVMKYFLIQSTASVFLLSAVSQMFEFSLMKNIMIVSLMIKIGVAPVHFWLLPIVESMDWFVLFMMLTIQKMAVFLVLSYNFYSFDKSNMFLFFISISAFVGSVSALYQNSLRKILTFSSISNKGWMLLAVEMNKTMWLLYFFIYSVILSSVITTTKTLKMDHMSDLMNKTKNEKKILLLSLLSLSGLPPFSGFFNKVIILMQVNHSFMKIAILPLLISVLISLFFYLRMTFYLMNNSFKTKKKHNFVLSGWIILLNIIGLLLGPMIMIMF